MDSPIVDLDADTDNGTAADDPSQGARQGPLSDEGPRRPWWPGNRRVGGQRRPASTDWLLDRRSAEESGAIGRGNDEVVAKASARAARGLRGADRPSHRRDVLLQLTHVLRTYVCMMAGARVRDGSAGVRLSLEAREGLPRRGRMCITEGDIGVRPFKRAHAL
ncbi:hypothetical protein BDY21DRAFT_75965 [Lineolata rhizophorae]|uniref:Uncharacterized protein n=1 Tax=Lineolata rhizophorae TaxID=578093 RepID=A0A6A6NUN1_9PEZI|nr:hypothetical protein BDY21DRAFT_75965 [Lineolata rhizophorae]